jgi:hypothetical protein
MDWSQIEDKHVLIQITTVCVRIERIAGTTFNYILSLSEVSTSSVLLCLCMYNILRTMQAACSLCKAICFADRLCFAPFPTILFFQFHFWSTTEP